MSEEKSGEAWRWRVEDQAANEGLNLLYEPGTWGDLIKGAWAVEVATALSASRRPLRVLDPFAGAADYPLVEASADRLDQVPPGSLLELVRSFGQRFPSTAALAQRAVERSGCEATLDVYDVDPTRRETWGGRAGATALDLTTGDAALGSDHDLVLVDPYDLFERFEALLPLACKGPQSQTVLFYLFNKAPRSAPLHKRYLGLRDRLSALAGERRVLIGRIPSDAILPRAFHEVLLVAPRELAASLESSLCELTVALSRVLTDGGAFEAR
jgi:hypothetical protein